MHSAKQVQLVQIGEREIMVLTQMEKLQDLLSRYHAPQRLRPRHKTLVKKIKSLQQGHDGTVALCFFCKELSKIDNSLELHHVNHKTYDNSLENLEVVHATCNRKENARFCHQKQAVGSPDPSHRSSVSMRDQNSSVQANERTVTNESANYSSKEGIKHDVQRHIWNNWLQDKEKGPFKGATSKSLYPSALAKLAPWSMGRFANLDGPLGSSVTYRRFIEEDIAGGILFEDVDELGKRIVFLKQK